MTFSSAAAASPAAASTAAAAAITNQCPRTVPRTLLAAVALLSAAAAVVSFAGPHMAGSAFKLSKGKKIPDVVVDVTAPDVEKLRKVLGMAKDIWTVDQSTLTATLVVPAHKMGDVGNELEGQMNVKVEDLEKSMMKNWHERQQRRPSLSQSAKSDGAAPGDEFFDDYHPLASITKAMKGWVAESKAPNGLHKNAHYNASIGKTWENRDIPMITVGGGPGSKVIYIQATMHAREWIAATTAMWVAKELLTNKDPRVVALVKQYKWVIIPVANPDGYEFSRTMGNRLWRKNRNPNIGADGTGKSGDCIGVDMNRNWGQSWHLGDPDKQEITGSDGRQGSDDQCTYVYRGTGPFSEKETAAISHLFQRFKDEGNMPVAGIDLHSYSQTIMYPYGFTKEPTQNHANLKTCADRMKAVIDLENQAATGTAEVVTASLIESGTLPASSKVDAAPAYHPSLGPTSYRAFRSVDLYPAFGEFSDWAYSDGTNNKFSYCIELPDGPMGQQRYGFELPPNEIRSVGKDIFGSLLEMAACIAEVN